MTARSPGAFLLSATFHALIIGVAVFFAMMTDQRLKKPPQVLELVAGEGDNFAATEAPKLGTPGGLKIDVQPMPTPKAAPEPEPAPVEVAPVPPAPVVEPAPTPKVTPAPKEKAPTPKPTETVPNFKKQLLRKVWAADAKAKKEVAKQRAEEAKRLKKEEFDRMQREKSAKAASAKKSGSGSGKVSHIDTEGIAKGVIGGSANNKIGGAGGKALTSNGGALTDRYFAMLKQRVLNALEKPPGVSDDLEVEVVVTISASGRLSGARVIKSSGSDEFDRAVIAAFGRVTMPEHPEKRTEELELTFRTKDAGGG
ncbi:cell envelope integrity protein TolA [Opitutus sp. ER46]|uniref:cell envelope integrity protein TolA n=1 Tax=Opitutus sp. ER46 TaxID=2161864 RepID=UPI000D2F5AB8|nr:cell envelope integrity protein TolA [Opitutus sp. ER46]PTX94195.1 hypothetical protein DB354_10530 [Opitutus sp. ER46]